MIDIKALVVIEPNNIKIIDVSLPEIGPNDVLTKVHYCGICGTDIAIITGKSSFVESGLVKYPVRIGHEWSGVVEKVGSEVKDFKPGDHVVSETVVPCFKCKDCADGNYQFCRSARAVGTVGECWDGSYAEYMLMPSQVMYKLKPETDLKEAALIEPAGIAMSGLIRARIKPEDKVVVIGTGAIGLTAVGLLRAKGVERIIVIGRRDSKLEYAKKMGADVVINNRKQNAKDIILHDSNGKGADVVIETSGSLKVLTESLDFICTNGRLAMLGFYEQKLNDFDIDKVVLSAIELIGVAGMLKTPRMVIDILESGKTSFKPLITSIYPFEMVQEAIQKVIDNDDNRIKVLIEFN